MLQSMHEQKSNNKQVFILSNHIAFRPTRSGTDSAIFREFNEHTRHRGKQLLHRQRVLVFIHDSQNSEQLQHKQGDWCSCIHRRFATHFFDDVSKPGRSKFHSYSRPSIDQYEHDWKLIHQWVESTRTIILRNGGTILPSCAITSTATFSPSRDALKVVSRYSPIMYSIPSPASS